MKKKSKSVVIEIQNVTKTYVLRHEKPTLIESLIYRHRKSIFTALDKVSLNILEGDRLGVIGRNGSGKTTLLKLMAGITKPQQGSVKVKGKLVSLIDLSAGFHPDLTGEENIFLNGIIIGMDKDEILAKKQEIIEFADIGEFIDAPLYTYSSGMQLRLGFSIAIHSEPDILLLDEGLAVGDEGFRKKANQKLIEFERQIKTIVMVSHSLEELDRNCNKILWIDKGKVAKYGDKDLLLKKYKKSF